MTLNRLIKELKKLYDKKQEAFYAEIPSELGTDILFYLEQYREVLSTCNYIKIKSIKHKTYSPFAKMVYEELSKNEV